MKYFTIYKTVNKIDGKSYIGKHITDNLYDGYLGSGKYLKRSLKKYGKNCFKKTILFVFDNKEEMDKKEKELVNETVVKSKEIYNLKLGGDGGWDHIYNNKEYATIVGKMGYSQGLALLSTEKRKELGKNNYHKTLGKYIKSDDPLIQKKRSENVSRNNKKRGPLSSETKRKIGEKNSIHQKGKSNSQYGTCWIYSLTEKRSMKIKKNDIDEYLKIGWIKGRKIKYAKGSWRPGTAHNRLQQGSLP